MCKGVPAAQTPEVSLTCQRALLVQIAVAEVTGVHLAALCAGVRGDARSAFARQMAMYLCRLVFDMSLGDIAAAFGRDRSTAAHAIRRIEEAREQPEIDRCTAWLEAALRRAGGVYD